MITRLPTEPVTDLLVIEHARDTVWLRANLNLLRLYLDFLWDVGDDTADSWHERMEDFSGAWHACADRLTDFDYPRPLPPAN